MAEYIDRGTAIAKLTALEVTEPNATMTDVKRVLADMPVADVAPVVHAHWVVRFDGPYKRRRCYCSHCGKHNGVGGIAQNQEKPYCPNCGAQMHEDDFCSYGECREDKDG